MPGLVCRIRWCKGEPLGLSISPRPTFLDLPRELRDQVFYYSLVTPEPITVWLGTSQAPWNRSEGNHTVATSSSTDTQLTTLLSLLRCHRTVASEAATTFYKSNTFRFVGDDNWSPLYMFLQMIGEKNRGHLRDLVLRMPKPEQVWQHLDGTYTSLGMFDNTYASLGSWYSRRVCPSDEVPIGQLSPAVEGTVDRLDPAIKACFRILGRSGPPLTLTLMMDRGLLPGVQLLFNEQHPHYFDWSMVVPDIIERFRQAFTNTSGQASRVEVLWKGKCPKEAFARQMELVQRVGWEIADLKEAEEKNHNYTQTLTIFILRRKSLTIASLN